MNPYQVLGLDSRADADAVRAAWLEAVRRHPPDGDPEGFRRVREAYEALKDPERLLEARLFPRCETQGLLGLADLLRTTRCHVGPSPWLRALSG